MSVLNTRWRHMFQKTKMASQVSISTGCFVYKKSKKKRSNAIKTAETTNQASFRQEWQSIKNCIELLHLDTYGQVLSGLMNFIKESLSETSRLPSNDIIPTAVLVTGVNMPDHNAVFSALKRSIVDSVSSRVAFLTSNDAPNVKVLVSSFVQMILETFNDGADEEEETLKRNRRNMITLCEWYTNESRRRDDPLPRKKPKYGFEVEEGSDRPVIIVLKDIEAFKQDVIQDFISILREYVDRIPFVLIFGVSTSMSTVHNILSQSSLSKLAIETFQSQNPSSYLDVILKRILINNKFPFKLSHRILRLLSDVFIYNDLSVNTFVSGIKFCMMDYYYTNAFSILCCDSDSLDDRINEIGADGLEEVRRLPSFRGYVLAQPVKVQKSLILDDKHLKIVVRKLVSDLHRFHSEFFPMLYCIHAIVSTLPKFPLGRQLREVYEVCLEGDIAENQEFENSMKLLNLMAKDELIARLKSGCAAIEDYGVVSFAISQVQRSLAEIVSKLEDGDEQLEQLNKKTSSQPLELPKKMDRSALQQKLKEMVQSKRPISAYFALREEVVNILKEAAKNFLKSPSNYPLHEIFYYDSVKSVRCHFIGESRAAMQLALSDPNSYLKCQCCSIDDEGSILGSFPDICISYKLHLECGRLINLYDWLQAFIMITEQSKSSNSFVKNDKKKPDNQLMARFIRSVAELQFLGFVKGTARKTDHVVRLTW